MLANDNRSENFCVNIDFCPLALKAEISVSDLGVFRYTVKSKSLHTVRGHPLMTSEFLR